MLRTAQVDVLPEGTYRVATGDIARETTLRTGAQESNWARHVPGQQTSDGSGEAGPVRRFNVVRNAPAQVQIEDRLREINGSVLGVDGEVIHCELMVRGARQEIELHREVFDFEPEYGAPFLLSMRSDEGYRTPIATRREPARERNAEIVRRVAEIMQDF